MSTILEPESATENGLDLFQTFSGHVNHHKIFKEILNIYLDDVGVVYKKVGGTTSFNQIKMEEFMKAFGFFSLAKKKKKLIAKLSTGSK
jgi:hypothetical protein